MKQFTIENRIISEDSRPFIIAEAGVNYYDIARKRNIDPIEAAKLMIKEASMAGADSIKFQTYKAEELASKQSPSYWDTSLEPTRSQYELFKKFDSFGEEEYTKLSEYAKENNIIFLSTPFYSDAVDFLNKIMPVFKIASSDITNLPLIKEIANKNKPIFLSTGASNIKEIKRAIKTIENEGNNQIVILHCILNYPTKHCDANLGMIKHLKKEFPEYLIGYSDHTLPDPSMITLYTSVLFGAKVIEKHFTLDKTLSGNDHYHAMDTKDLRRFVLNLDILEKIVGKGMKIALKSESSSIKYARRSIVASTCIPKGTKITQDLVSFKRPGTGIGPHLLEEVIGQRVKRYISEDEVIRWDDINIDSHSNHNSSV